MTSGNSENKTKPQCKSCGFFMTEAKACFVLKFCNAISIILKMNFLFSSDRLEMPSNLFKIDLSISREVFPTRKSILTSNASAIFIITSIDGFMIPLSYLPIISPEVLTALSKAA